MRTWIGSLLLAGIFILFGAAALYATVKDPMGTSVNPIVDIYNLLSDLFGD